MPFLYDPGTGVAEWGGAQQVATAAETLVVGTIGAATETGYTVQGQATIPANTLVVGSLLRYRGKLVIADDSEVANATARVRIHSSSVAPSAGQQVLLAGPTAMSGNSGFEWQFDITNVFRAVGVTSDVAGMGYTTGSAFAVSGQGLVEEGGPNAGLPINTTTELQVTVTIEISAGTAPSVTLDFFAVEID